MESAVEKAKYDTGRNAAPSHGGRSAEAPSLHPMLQLQQQAGNQAVQELLRARMIQAKLAISQPDDPEEQEADLMADRVMRSHAGATTTACSCAAGEEMCDECRHQPKGTISRKAVNTGKATTGHGTIDRVLRSPGQAMDTATRAFFEPRFGRDFSNVHLHTGSEAAESARAVAAHAYALGSDIVFAQGKFDPQSNEGRRLLAHELTHIVQQGCKDVLYRDGDPTPPADVEKDRAEQEQKAFDAASSCVGKPAVVVWFSPQQDTRSPEIEQFSVAEVVKRPAGPENRLGFDAAGPALAYATLIAGGVGAVTLHQDKFYFAARLAEGNKALTGGDPEPVESSWWEWALPGFALGKKIGGALRQRSYVYRVDPVNRAVAGAVSQDGFAFPLGVDLQPDPGKSRFQENPSMPTAPDAESMRQIAGILPEEAVPGDQPPGMPDAVEIPEPEQRLFITSYFRARGLETLASNENTAARLTETFKPTTGGTVDHPGRGVSKGAKALIDSSRQLGRDYRNILEKEAQLAAQEWFIGQRLRGIVIQSRNTPVPKEYRTVAIGQESKPIEQWQQQIRGSQLQISNQKNLLLSLSPLLAQLVEVESPYDRLTYPSGDVPGRLPTVIGPNPYDESLLAKEATPENDDAIRVAFLGKLDAVREAIKRARSEIVGSDLDFLFGMQGLRERVKADFGRMSGKNAWTKDRLDQMLKEHDVKELVWNIGQLVIEVGLLFLPGGAFLSGAFGIAITAAQMAEHLRQWEVSQAAVDPSGALVDKQQAQERLATDTLFLAIAALNMALGVNRALSKMESTVSKALSSAAEVEPAASKALSSGAGAAEETLDWSVAQNRAEWGALTRNVPEAGHIFEMGKDVSRLEELAIIDHSAAADMVALEAGSTGADSIMLSGGGRVGPEALAEMLAQSGWKGGLLRLISCSTGKCNIASKTIFGDQLARALGARGMPTVVAAPKGLVEVGGKITMGTETIETLAPIASKPKGAGVGAFRYFGPYGL